MHWDTKVELAAESPGQFERNAPRRRAVTASRCRIKDADAAQKVLGTELCPVDDFTRSGANLFMGRTLDLESAFKQLRTHPAEALA
eukprot:971772-Amphidinium_carterae.1